MTRKNNKKNKPIAKESSAAIEKKNQIVLPHYGFAEDILGARERNSVRQDATLPSEVIYTFADRLKEKQKVEARKEEEADIIETWVIFTLAEELYALPVSHVQEILRAVTITRVPDAPHPVRGITNMRGSVLPVVDLRIRLGLKKGQIESSYRILVVESRKRLIGLLVDAVHEVKRISINKVQLPPEDIMTKKSDYILGVYQLEENLIILLDVDRVLLIHGSSDKDTDIPKQNIDPKINIEKIKGENKNV